MKSRRFLRTAEAALFSFFLFLIALRAQGRLSKILLSSVSDSAATHPTADEKLLLDSANRERAAAKLRLLHWDDALAAGAEKHAELMVREHKLSHGFPGELSLAERAAQAGAKFSMIAENVALGPDAPEIHDGWMHSPGHRKNILNPSVSAVGIAVLKGGPELFAVEDFSKPVEDLSLSQQESRVVALLKAAGIRTATATEDARKTCATNSGYAGESVSAVYRFEVSNLDTLPDQLGHAVKSRAYRVATVGACRGGDEAGFTRYRMAVLLR